MAKEHTIHLTGYLNGIQSLKGSLSSSKKIIGTLSTIIMAEEIENYDGIYTVIPLAFENQILETGNKRMLDNVTVTSIPYHEVTNDAGGYTVSIVS